MGYKLSPEQLELLRATASADPSKGADARRAFAATLTAPLRKARDKASTVRAIFTVDELQPGADARYPLDMTDVDAYLMSKDGAVPQHLVTGDEIWIPTFEIAGDVNWKLQYARDGRFDVIARAKQRLANAITKKEEENGWRVLLTASDAANREAHITGSGFVKELVSEGKVLMARQGGSLTDLYISPEAMADVRSWDYTQIDPTTAREIYKNGGQAEVYGTVLHTLEELGTGREYNKLFCDLPTNSIADATAEVQIGFDLGTNDAFYMPVRQNLTTYDNPVMIAQLKQGVIAYEELGFACVDTRRVLYTYFAV